MWLLYGVRVGRDSKENNLGFLQSKGIYGFILMFLEVLDCLLHCCLARLIFWKWFLLSASVFMF